MGRKTSAVSESGGWQPVETKSKSAQPLLKKSFVQLLDRIWLLAMQESAAVVHWACILIYFIYIMGIWYAGHLTGNSQSPLSIMVVSVPVPPAVRTQHDACFTHTCCVKVKILLEAEWSFFFLQYYPVFCTLSQLEITLLLPELYDRIKIVKEKKHGTEVFLYLISSDPSNLQNYCLTYPGITKLDLFLS